MPALRFRLTCLAGFALCLAACEDSAPAPWQPLSKPPVLLINDAAVGIEPFRVDTPTGDVSLLIDANAATPGSNPGPGAALGNAVLFGADDGIHGHELWRTDGTVTEQVAELCAGACGEIRQVHADGEQAWIVAAGTDGSDTLWVSDGTSPGTVPVISAAHEPGTYTLTVLGRTPQGMVIAEGMADGTLQLSVTDGTAEGTHTFTSIDTASVVPRAEPGVTRDGVAYFALWMDIWRSDGTVEGTRRLPLSRGNADGPAPIQVGGMIYFSNAVNAASAEGVTLVPARRALSANETFTCYWNGADIWIGTDVEQRLLWSGDDPLPVSTSTLDNRTAAGSAGCFFLGETENHQSFWLAPLNGTAAIEIAPLPTLREFNRFDALGIAGENVIVLTQSQDQGEPPGRTVELWSFAGTEAVSLGRIATATAIAPLGGSLLLEIDGEPWLSDGTPSGTLPLRDINKATTLSSWPNERYNDGDLTYFSVATADHDARSEVFVTDGSSAGSRKVADNIWLSTFRGRTPSGSLSIAPGDDASSIELQVMDLITRSRMTLATGCVDPSLVGATEVPAEDLTVFAFAACGELWLWRSDGTIEGTSREVVATYPIDPYPWSPPSFKEVKLVATRQWIYLSGCHRDSAMPCSLWRINPAGGPASPAGSFADGTQLLPVNDILFLLHHDALSVFRDDATAMNVLTTGLPPGGHQVEDVTRLANRDLLFTYSDGSVVPAGRRLWARNGDSVELLLEMGSRRVNEVMLSGDLAYFLVSELPAWDGSISELLGELWRTDGTAAGTWRIADQVMTPDPSAYLLRCNNWLQHVLSGAQPFGRLHGTLGEMWFQRRTPDAGFELWFTDGSRAPARQVTHLPGEGCDLVGFL